MFNSMEYIYEVYKERSFSKAAANLYISQPSLSATVKKTEAKIGAPSLTAASIPSSSQNAEKCISNQSRKLWISRIGLKIM